MGRRKWKLYQDAIIPRRSDPGEPSSDEESMPAAEAPPPALKIKTIEQINAPDGDAERPRTERDIENRSEGIESTEARADVQRSGASEPRSQSRPETILESLIKRPATQPKLEYPEEPVDWKPQEKCYFCVDGDQSEIAAGEGRVAGGATSPASESDSSSVSGAKSPGAPPQQLLQHLLQIQNQSPQALAQFQQMMAALAALGTGLVPPALSQAWLMQRLAQQTQLMQQQQHVDRLSAEIGEKVSVSSSSPSLATEQPLDLSAKSSSSSTPPPDSKFLENARLKRAVLESAGGATRRAYTADEMQAALRDVQSGRLGTRRAAAVYGIPRSTLRNKVYKLASDAGHDSELDSDPERDSPTSVILKIPTFPPPDEKSSSPATPVTTPVTPVTPLIPPPQPSLNPPSQLLLPPSVFADSPSQRLFSISDVIAKSISQKFQQPLERPLQPDHSFMRAPDRHVSVIKTPPDNQRNYPCTSNSRGATNNGTQSAGGKGTRPKRGKYRNYDRDSLVEAVKAVQRGEMSVHRAGSYYGVPHSTLEYKVKERHLMRPRKREPKPQPDLKPQLPKPPQPKLPTKPFSNGLNGPETAGGYPTGYPFWPGPGFQPPPAPELFASHMMRRLREDAAPPSANGSFLEGIIRSSLERPGALLQRLTAEPTRPTMPGTEAPSLLRRLAGDVSDESPPARRPRLSSSDRQLAAEMRDAVQRLRADKMRPRNGTPTPPATSASPAACSPAPAPAPAPPDRA